MKIDRFKLSSPNFKKYVTLIICILNLMFSADYILSHKKNDKKNRIYIITFSLYLNLKYLEIIFYWIIYNV